MKKIKNLLSLFIIFGIVLCGCGNSDLLNFDEPAFKERYEEITDSLCAACIQPMLSTQLYGNYNYEVWKNPYAITQMFGDTVIDLSTVKIDNIGNVYKSGGKFGYNVKFCGIDISFCRVGHDETESASFVLILTSGMYNYGAVLKGFTDTRENIQTVADLLSLIDMAIETSDVKIKLDIKVDYYAETIDMEYLNKMLSEKLEGYIADPYAQLDDSYQQTIQSVTEQITTAETTTTTAIQTTASKTQEKTEESEIYLIYLAMLNEMDAQFKREYDDMFIPYYQYYIYDINHDGIYELLVHVGESEADAVILVYSVDESGGLLEPGEIGGGHMQLVEKDGKLYSNMCRMGYQKINEIKMADRHGVWSVAEENVFEESNLTDYRNYGTAVKSYDISDTSAIEALCPKDALADKPYVHAYVKTYDYSGRDGFESRLYLDGDFSVVSVLIQSMGDTREIEFYSKEDYDDYIDMRFNAAASPPSVVYVTPYSDSGVAGDVVVCDIPTDISGTIQTGGWAGVLNSEMKGQINCHGGTVAGFTTDYVVNGGVVGKVRNSLGDKWHVTAKNVCYNYDVTWYELWDSDDGDYYGWVDSGYIDFY